MESISKNFEMFHYDNPHVYDELWKLACDLHARGHRHYSMKGLFEVLRWHRAMKTTDEDFKLNNNYTAYYARLIMENDDRLEGFFRLRDSGADHTESL
jgi:hypothetical protein